MTERWRAGAVLAGQYIPRRGVTERAAVKNALRSD